MAKTLGALAGFSPSGSATAYCMEGCSLSDCMLEGGHSFLLFEHTGSQTSEDLP